MKLRPFAVACGVALLLAPLPQAQADVKEVWLGVEGATCPKCGFSLTKALNRVEGVAHTRFSVTPQRMEVSLQPGAWVDPGRMVELTRKTNLKPLPEDVRLRVTGTLAKRGDSFVLVLDQMKTPVQLTIASHRTAPRKGQELSELGEKRVEVSGYWSTTLPMTLSVTAFRLL